MKQPNKFKGGSGAWKTRGLFCDLSGLAGFGTYDSTEAVYCFFEPNPTEKRPALKHLFLALGDSTGIKLANLYLGGYEHLKQLLECRWFKDGWDVWQEELALTVKMKALETIKAIAEEGSAQSLGASKYLANREYEVPASKRGRPSKEELSGAMKAEIKQLTQAEEDYARVTNNLTLLSGGKK